MQHFARQLPKVLKKSDVSVSDRILADLLMRWEDIAGADFIHMTLPYKITWLKARGQKGEENKKQAVLHILCPDAMKTRLMFQEAIFLDRCNRGFKRPLFTKIQATHSDSVIQKRPKPAPANIKKTENPAFLDHITDPALRDCLASLGQAIASENQ